MSGSVRTRLTVAVAGAVGLVALAAALVAPRIVRDSLIDDRIDAQRELEAAELANTPRIGVTGLGTAELTALFGPDIAELTHELDAVAALGQLRAVDPQRNLHVLVYPGDDLVATVTLDGRVRVQADPTGQIDRPIVSHARLQRLAAEYGAENRSATFPQLLSDATTFERFLDDIATRFSIDIAEYLDPNAISGLPEFTNEPFPRDLYESLRDDLPQVTEVDRPSRPDATTVAVETRTIEGRPMLLTASTDGIENTVDRLRTLLWLGVPIAVAAAALVTWLLAGRSLRPVAAITERTRQIRSSTLHERVPVPSSHDEIAALATEMNTMLDRVQREDERRRQFVSDASHELRSPIATIRAQAEAALTDEAQAELAAGILAEAERMSVLVDDLLSLARHDEQLAPPGQVVDLDDLVYADAARPRRIPVDVGAVSAGQVRGRADELARVVTHLLDNAARHAESRVAVALGTADDGTVKLVVDDDGPGIPPDDRERVFERFVRLDDARSRDAGGAGLGLAVVSSVVRSVGGTITAAESPLGGARVEATFPAV